MVSLQEAKNLIKKVNFNLKNVVWKPVENGSCSSKEAKFVLSKINSFSVPHFNIIWNIFKNPLVDRPIIAGYNWILTPPSIFVSFYLKEFYCKFDGILKDSLSFG